MDLRSVDINLIMVLDAILAEKNLTKAGELIGMTPPAVSGALARLRQQYDDPLLVRSGRGFELTPKAEQLIPAVREVMIEIDRTLHLLPTFTPEDSNRTFLIAASDYLMSEITGPLLEVIEHEAPGVNVSFDALPGNIATVMPEDLLRKDIFIAADMTTIPGKKQALFTDPFVCLVDKKNPNLEKGKLSIEDLSSMRQVRSSFGQVVISQLDEIMSNAGVSSDIGVTVRGFLAVPFQLQNTAMYGVVPKRVADRFAYQLGLTIAETPIEGVLVETAYWHPSKTNDPALKWLLAKIRQAAEKIELGVAT